jgi:NADPH:quinone reductase-like Zn-dependent oxidoreductase
VYVELSRPGGPEVLVVGERAIPTPAPDNVVIRSEFAGVNFTVHALGSDLDGVALGDRVVGLP